MARVGVDLDGVLYDFGAAFRDYMISEHSWKPEWCVLPKRWEFYEDWGISLAGFKRLCHDAADKGVLWNKSGPIMGWSDVEALCELRDAGHTIHIVTHRGFGSHRSASHEATARWLGQFKVPYDTLTFSGDKTIIKTDFFIEDNVDNYLALEKAGCRSVLITRPWNEHLGDAVRVSSVACFVDLVLGEAA